MFVLVIPGLDPGSPEVVCYRAFFVVSCHFSFSINNCVIVYYANGGIAISKKFIL
jgi:hypothetical protein